MHTDDDDNAKRKDGELKVTLSDHVKKQMAGNPEMEAAMRDIVAIFHQAQHGLSTGQYESMEDALEALTGNRPVKIDPLHPDFEEVSDLMEAYEEQDDDCGADSDWIVSGVVTGSTRKN